MSRGAQASLPISPAWATLHNHSYGVIGLSHSENNFSVYVSERRKSALTFFIGSKEGSVAKALIRFRCMYFLNEYAVGNARSAHLIGNIPLESTASNRTLQNFAA